MSFPARRTPLLLRLVLVKKLLEAGVLFLAALLSVAASRHYQELPHWADRLGTGHHLVLETLVHEATDMGPWRLHLTAVATALFAVLITVACVATLQHRSWGEWMLLIVFLAMLALEGLDLLREPNGMHGLVLAITLVGTVLVMVEMRQGRRENCRPGPP